MTATRVTEDVLKLAVDHVLRHQIGAMMRLGRRLINVAVAVLQPRSFSFTPLTAPPCPAAPCSAPPVGCPGFETDMFEYKQIFNPLETIPRKTGTNDQHMPSGLSTGKTKAFPSQVPTSGPTLVCLWETIFPDMPCVKKNSRRQKRHRSTGQQPGTKSKCGPTDKPVVRRRSCSSMRLRSYCLRSCFRRDVEDGCSHCLGVESERTCLGRTALPRLRPAPAPPCTAPPRPAALARRAPPRPSLYMGCPCFGFDKFMRNLSRVLWRLPLMLRMSLKKSGAHFKVL